MSDLSASLIKLVVDLHSKDAIKFGDFKLKSGISSPVYFDLRVIVSFPELMKDVSREIWQVAKNNNVKVDCICGVPYTALPIATVISVNENIPMLIKRKEAKEYGTKKMIEGRFSEGDRCLIIEDVVTSGTSVLETTQILHDHGLVVTDAIVLLNRQQGGSENLLAGNVKLHSVIGIRTVCEILEQRNLLDPKKVAHVKAFIDGNSTIKPPKSKVLTYAERGNLCTNAMSKRIFEVMEHKQTNLILSADVTTSKQLLDIAELVGPHICMLKTHIDILEDFTESLIVQLLDIASRLNFVIFEDRKFADIGKTVVSQYTGGMYHISEWADVVNVHAVPGPGVIEALQRSNEGVSGARGCLIVAQMSSEANLAVKSYTDAAVQMSKQYSDYVIGFICQQKLSDDPTIIHMSPGVKMDAGGDSLGQQYNTPSSMIVDNGTDCIIVGRGITESNDPCETAALYRRAGFEAYLSTLL